MRIPRKIIIPASMFALLLGGVACTDDAGDVDATTTTGLTPQEVEGSGEGDNTPGDDPGTGPEDTTGGSQDEPGTQVGGEQSNP